jgi:hypothetical protein
VHIHVLTCFILIIHTICWSVLFIFITLLQYRAWSVKIIQEFPLRVKLWMFFAFIFNRIKRSTKFLVLSSFYETSKLHRYTNRKRYIMMFTTAYCCLSLARSMTYFLQLRSLSKKNPFEPLLFVTFRNIHFTVSC